MFHCQSTLKREFYESSIREPPKSTSPLHELFKHKPWRKILKRETAKDVETFTSDDENCSITKNFLDNATVSSPPSDIGCRDEQTEKQMECWRNLMKMKEYVPELGYIMNDIHYATSDEESDSYQSSAFENINKLLVGKNEQWSKKNNDNPKRKVLTAQNVTNQRDSTYFTQKENTLEDFLYENEEFASALNGIVYKEILELLNFEDNLEDHRRKLRRKRRAPKTEEFIDMSYFASKVMDDISKKEKPYEPYLPSETSKIFAEGEMGEEMTPYYEDMLSTAVEETTGFKLKKADDDEEEEEEEEPAVEEQIEEMTDFEKSVLSIRKSRASKMLISNWDRLLRDREAPSSDEIDIWETKSNADFLFGELLGALNIEDILEEWRVAKRELNKVDETVKVEME